MDNFKSIANPKTLNFNDTFLNFEHLRQSFPMYDVKVDVPESDLVPPFKVSLFSNNLLFCRSLIPGTNRANIFLKNFSHLIHLNFSNFGMYLC